MAIRVDQFLAEVILKRIFMILFCLPVSLVIAQDSREEILIKLDSVDLMLDEDEDGKAKLLLNKLENQEALKNDPYNAIYFHTLNGDYFLSTEKYAEAVKAYESLLNFSSQDLNKKATLKLARGINDLGIAYMKLNRYDEALIAHSKSIELYDRYNEPQGGAYNHNNIALIFSELKQLDSAIFHYNKSKEYALMAKDTMGVGYNLLNLALLYADNNEPVKALDHFHKSLNVFEEMNHVKMLNRTQTRLAKFYARMRDYDTAEALLQKVLKYYQAAVAKKGLTGTHLAIADLLLKKNELDSVSYHLDKGLSFSLESNYQADLAEAYQLKAIYFMKLDELDKAFENYEKVIVHSGDQLKGMKMNGLTGMASIYLQKNQFREAISFALKALDEVNYSASSGNLAKAYEILYKAHKELKNHKASLKYYELIAEEKGKLFSDERMMEFARIEYQNQLEREKELREIEEQQKELAYHQQLAKEKWIRYSLLTVSILVGLIALFAFRGYHIKRESNQQLTEQNQKLEELRKREQELSSESLAAKERELATMAMASLEKNSMLQELEQKVSFIEQRLGEEMKPSLKEMRKTISGSIDLDKSWDSFMHRFEDVHPRFFDKLKEENPSLTINDLKLSAYVKIGMSNKEIANVSHLTLGSVKSKINRLKKKLDLGAEDSVRDYMLKYA